MWQKRRRFFFATGYEMWETYRRHYGEVSARYICQSYIDDFHSREERFLSELGIALRGKQRKCRRPLYKSCFEMWEEKWFCSELQNAMQGNQIND